MLVTALVTPFRRGGAALDLERVRGLVAFQLSQGVDHVLLGGTTGEGAALSDGERLALVDAALEVARPGQIVFCPGTGRLDEMVARVQGVLSRGVRTVLLVDCPYSGPSSASLRTHWHGAVAAAVPDVRLIPYAVPGRTGTELLPDDLARLREDHPQVIGVKDATGRLARMARVRELCGDDFVLLCGDDGQVRSAMLDPDIRAQGVCSVAANLVPAAMAELVSASRKGDEDASRAWHDQLAPLFGLVSVTAEEVVRVDGRVVSVPQRARNPVPVKTALQHLGVLEEGCRAPLGPMGEAGTRHVLGALASAVRPGRDPLEPLRRRMSPSPRSAGRGPELAQAG